MKLIYLDIKGFKPLSLSNIEHLQWTLTNPLQIILGTNGSGKSSLLRAAAPTFTHKSEYRRGGYEKAIWEDNKGHHYHLTSDYRSATPSYRFEVEEKGELVNLNPGGTGTIQKELIETKIGYNAKIHELLCQHTKFTEMSPKEREELIHYLNSDQMEFAYRLFAQFRNHYRDITSVSKHIQTKYEDFCSRLSAMGDFESTEKKVKELESVTDQLISQTNWSLNGVNPSARILKNDQDEMKKLVQEIDKISLRIDEYEQSIPKDGILNVNDLADVYYRSLSAQETFQKSIQDTQKDLEQTQQLVRALDECPDEVDEVGLAQQIKQLEQPVREGEQRFDGVYFEPSRLTEIESFKECLLPIVIRAESGFTSYTAEQTRSLNKRQIDLNESLGFLKHDLNHLESRISQANEAKMGDIECPECHHVILGDGSVSPEQLDAMDKRRQAMLEKLEELEKLTLSNQTKLDEANDYNQLVEAFQSRVNQFPWVSQWIHEQGTIGHCLRHLNKINLFLSNYRDEVAAYLTWCQQRQTYRKFQDYMAIIQSNHGVDQKSRFNQLTHDYEQMVKEYNQLCEKNQIYSKLIEQHRRRNEKGNQLNQLVAHYSGEFTKWVEYEKTLSVNQYMQKTQTLLAELRRSLSEFTNLENRRLELEKESNELESRKSHTLDLIKALSPQYGIIAQQSRETLTTFIQFVNQTIDYIWEHPLFIETPKKNGNLNYRFLLMVDGELRDDIKLGSSGEKDVINLAVTLAIMSQKHLIGYPLYLDEFGNRFDYVHRRNLLLFIEKLMRQGTISQVLMVNHFLSDYGGLTDSDVIVLDDRNILTAGLSYNQNITFES